MKKTKDIIYEYVQKEIHTNRKAAGGLDTKTIADALRMQRSNVSALLNTLVSEEKLIKTATRPVLYSLPKESPRSCHDCFTRLIGYNGSLRKAVQLAKAAILYPPCGLHVLLSSQSGCGTTAFAETMFQFALEKGILSETCTLIRINCRHYTQNISALNDELFGISDDIHTSCFARARGSMLFIDNIDLLEARQLSRIYDFLDTGRLYSENHSEYLELDHTLLVLSCSPQSCELLNRRIPVVIELPELEQRPLPERFELINHFFLGEAVSSCRCIEVNAEAVIALIMTSFPYNIKELSMEIKAACANAYVRIVNDPRQNLYICLNDFKNQVRKGMMHSKEEEQRISSLLNIGNKLFYDPASSEEAYDGSSSNIYADVKKQYLELSKQGIHNTHIETAMHAYIQNLFKKVYSYQQDPYNGLQQLAKIIDPRVIQIVTRTLELCKKTLHRDFAPNVCYGLCLHIHSLLTRKFSQQQTDRQQIIEIIKKYPNEYACGVQFADVLRQELDLELPMDEIVFITMFLVEAEENQVENHPLLLYVLHGSGIANSLKEVTNAFTHCHNAYSYDLNLDMDLTRAMQELKALIMQIDNGQGILVIYDMGSIKTMLDTIGDETNIKLRYINIPITLMGIDIARKCAAETDIDYIYHMARLELEDLQPFHKKNRPSVIITLCHTGEGGAMQLKHYVDQYSRLNMKTIPLAISNREELIKEVSLLQKTYDIHAFIGTYDPKLLGIPFIPIAKIFENTREDLDRILLFEPVHSRSFDYREVYDYLETQLQYVSVAKLKTLLPDTIDRFSIPYDLSNDQKIGLFMHIACLIERLLEGKTTPCNEEKDKLFTLFKEDYKLIRSFLKPLERTFKIIIDDNEVATIMMIVKKI